MPIILVGASAPQPSHSTGRHDASALVGDVVTGRHFARGGWLGSATGRHEAGVAALDTATGRHLARGISGAPDNAPAPAVPVDIIYGVPRPHLHVTCSLPNLLHVSLEEGDQVSATFTVAGPPPAAGGTVSATVRTSGLSGVTGRVAGTLQPYEIRSSTKTFTLDLDDQFEVDGPAGQEVTTLRAFSRPLQALDSVRLPEFVPFMLKPTPRPPKGTGCESRPPPQKCGVTSIVREAAQAAGVSLSFPMGDPLAGQQWTEWSAPYSTLGRSPRQVIEDTYGAAGHLIIPRGTIGPPALLIFPPLGQVTTGPDLSPDQTAGNVRRRRETAQTPASVTVTGVDYAHPLPSIEDLLATAPDPASLGRELYKDNAWYVNSPTSDGSGEVITSYRKSGGQLVNTTVITAQNVTVREMVDETEQIREFGKVLTAWESTQLDYHTICKDMLLRQNTRKRSWGYSLSTQTSTVIASGPAYIGGWPAGDPQADELELVEQTWSPEGYLSRKVITTVRISSMKQRDPEADPKERGPLQTHELVERIRSETYFPDGNGGWWMEWQESGGQPTPLYDEVTLEAIRLTVRTGTVISGRQKLDSAPPMARCPEQCGERRRKLPNVLRVRSPDGRQGNDVTRTISWTRDRASLGQYARWTLLASGRRDVTELTLLAAPHWTPGHRSPTGLLHSLSLSVGPEGVTTRVTRHQELATRLEDAPAPEGDRTHRDLVLHRMIGGVLVDHFTGKWTGNTPEFTKQYVVVSGTESPASFDEIEWVDDPRYGPTTTGNYGQEAQQDE